MENLSRRDFLKTSTAVVAGVSLTGLAFNAPDKPLWRHSVAE